MKFKSNVRMYEFMIIPALKILQAVQEAAPSGYEPTVTSACDGKHSETSLHAHHRAFDIRVYDYPGYKINDYEATRGAIEEWIERMRLYLPPNEYDIIFGDKHHRDHIHIEWDPKYK